MPSANIPNSFFFGMPTAPHCADRKAVYHHSQSTPRYATVFLAISRNMKPPRNAQPFFIAILRNKTPPRDESQIERAEVRNRRP